MARDPVALNRAAAWLARLLAVAMAALVVTGLPLILLYQPRGGWSWLSTAHSLASSLFLGAAVAMLALALAVAFARTPPWAGWFLTLGVMVVAVAGSFTGQLLSWDQIALKAVTVGSSYQGMLDPLRDDVRFLIIAGTEVSQGSFLAWLLVHVLAVPAAVVAVGLPLWRRMREDESGESGGLDESAGNLERSG